MHLQVGGQRWEPLAPAFLPYWPHPPSPWWGPYGPPTLADAVSCCAAQLEASIAAALPGPLHLGAAGRTAEGGIASHTLRGSCRNKTPQGHPPHTLPAGPQEVQGRAALRAYSAGGKGGR